MKHLGFTALGRVAVNHLNIEVLCLMYFSDGSHRAFKQGHSNARNKLIFHGPLLKFSELLKGAVFTLGQIHLSRERKMKRIYCIVVYQRSNT